MITGDLLSRITIIDNSSGVPVELRECPKGDPYGASCPAILLEPNNRRFIPARNYRLRSIDSGIPRVIKLFSKGVCFGTLSPEDFITNIKLRVMINHDGQLAVTKVRATTLDQFRIKALVCFLGNITGRTEEAT